MPRKPTVRARGLGAELKELRLQSGLTTREAGDRAGWSHTMISRIEIGKRGVTTEEIATLLAIYQVKGDDRDRLIELAREAHRPGWWESSESSLPSQLAALISFESQATAITDVALILVPGLLQTSGYTRAVMAATGIEKNVAETRVAARLGRQAILKGEDGPSLQAFIDEAVLRRPLGGGEVMTNQLDHLVESSKDPRVCIRVLPQTSAGHIALNGPFTVLEFKKAQPLVHLEHRRSSLFLDEPRDIDAFRADVATLTETALDPAESVDLMTEIAQNYRRQ
ncbi:helix-turn-helix domain-containing protein [Streptomonospora litoralis]|uniref:Helix-turn-helix protein n=1 Tax=Streptomonospora litoralis TaxID=2498135 RepID=A0A4P6Q883_9ACTN|nr:helix-turn-helix transcriptional regulator [Streptomonospora litoralis]QBI55254.1 Helix-turn-helix protein [Streptomonospora litoralis]